jgi:hypothetical protein
LFCINIYNQWDSLHSIKSIQWRKFTTAYSHHLRFEIIELISCLQERDKSLNFIKIFDSLSLIPAKKVDWLLLFYSLSLWKYYGDEYHLLWKGFRFAFISTRQEDSTRETRVRFHRISFSLLFYFLFIRSKGKGSFHSRPSLFKAFTLTDPAVPHRALDEN